MRRSVTLYRMAARALRPQFGLDRRVPALRRLAGAIEARVLPRLYDRLAPDGIVEVEASASA